MDLKSEFKKAAFVTVYVYAGLACFAALVGSTLLSLLPLSRPRRERRTRRLIHGLCAGLVALMKGGGFLEVDFGELPALAGRRGVIIAVNHPTYLDAILIMSQLPEVFCLVKASILGNRLLAGTVRNAGYESNVKPAVLTENCRARLRRGENLLVFPEGTRTQTGAGTVGPFKRGFALFAAAAPAPVVTVFAASSSSGFLCRNRSFFRFPETLPLRYRFAVSEEFSTDADESPRAFSERVETHFRTALPLSGSLLS